MKKTFAALLVVFLLLPGLTPSAHAVRERFTDSSTVSGSDYTDLPALANSLDLVFAGELGLCTDYNCTIQATTPLGSSKVPPGTVYFLPTDGDTPFGGYSCYIYANAVYAFLFGDIPGTGNSSQWKNSITVLENKSLVSYEMFTQANVRTGALLRSTKNADGSYNNNFGHSVIILSYDRDTVRYLDGNGNGKGLIRITHCSWSEFNYDLFTRRNYRLSFVVEPTEAYYSELADGFHDYIGYFAQSRVYSSSFTDVACSDWSYSSVAAAYELGLMNGREGNLFAPTENVSVVEALTLKARMLSCYWDDKADFAPEAGDTWYEPYLRYCELWGIDIGAYGDLFSPITRGDFARLCYAAVPAEALENVRDIPAGSIPDVTSDMDCAEAVYALYEAGILTGSGGEFSPQSPLTRGQAATVAARFADRAQRADG